MSTPSTAAVTTLPTPYFSRHQAYQPQTSTYNLVNGAPRLPGSQYSSSTDLRRTAATITSRQTNQLPPLKSAQPSPDMNSNTSNYRKPDWNEFYKNGVPEEVIIIDDDSPEPPSHNRADAPPYENGNGRHADKKRKMGAASAYDPVYNPQPSYSTTQTPYYDNSSGNNTVSTDRTAPVYKATDSSSIGPAMTNGAYVPLDEGVVGQKRKRTRQLTADEVKAAKRRELDRVQSPYSAYIPPPRPPIKAKDVFVEAIRGVSLLLMSQVLAANVSSQSYSKEKVDDDDGHYVINPEADLTDRCMSSSFANDVLPLGVIANGFGR
jgi:dual-specificity kinase